MKIYIKQILFFSVFTIFYSSSISQDSFKEKFEKANSLMNDKLFDLSKGLWIDLANSDTTNANVNYKTGICLLNTSDSRFKSLIYLTRALNAVNKIYNPNDHTIKTAPIEIYFYIGESFHINNKLDSSEKYISLFLNSSSNKHYLREKAKLILDQINNASILLTDKKNYQIINMGNEINSRYDDYSPVFLSDEKTLYFTSKKLRTDSNFTSNKVLYSNHDGKHYADTYVNKKNKNNSWQKSKLTDFSKYNSHQSVINISFDELKLYLSQDNTGNETNIFYSDSKLSDDNFLDFNFLEEINSKSKETHISISNDGNIIFFSSNREGGFGGFDLYRSIKLPNGKWSEAFNLGETINSKHDEIAPYISKKGDILYFSSNNTKSIGGYDIFFSKIHNKEIVGEFKNMSYPINSTSDEIDFSITEDTKRGFFASNRDKGKGGYDIYKIVFDSSYNAPSAILKGKINKGNLKELPSGIIIWIYDLTNNANPNRYIPERKTGEYVLSLIPCHKYLVEYTLKDSIFYETEFELPCNTDYNEIHKVISIAGVSIPSKDKIENHDATIVDTLKNKTSNSEKQIQKPNIKAINYQIYYGYNKKELQSENKDLFSFIEEIIKIIKINGEVKLELEGSASKVPTNTFNSNQDLADKRCINAKNIILSELKKHNISSKNIIFISEKAIVQGPEYNNDAYNKQKYSKYQYIKIVAH